MKDKIPISKRSEIYLRAAEKEDEGNCEGHSVLINEAEISVFDWGKKMYSHYPELELLDGKTFGIEKSERNKIRVLALLFAHQMTKP